MGRRDEPLQESLGLNDPDCTWVQIQRYLAAYKERLDARVIHQDFFDTAQVELQTYDKHYSKPPPGHGSVAEFLENKYKSQPVEFTSETVNWKAYSHYVISGLVNQPSAILPICQTN